MAGPTYNYKHPLFFSCSELPSSPMKPPGPIPFLSSGCCHKCLNAPLSLMFRALVFLLLTYVKEPQKGNKNFSTPTTVNVTFLVLIVYYSYANMLFTYRQQIKSIQNLSVVFLLEGHFHHCSSLSPLKLLISTKYVLCLITLLTRLNSTFSHSITFTEVILPCRDNTSISQSHQ